jgi:hypothetical protein
VLGDAIKLRDTAAARSDYRRGTYHRKDMHAACQGGSMRWVWVTLLQLQLQVCQGRSLPVMSLTPETTNLPQ